jgi:hypothetical protein
MKYILNKVLNMKMGPQFLFETYYNRQENKQYSYTFLSMYFYNAVKIHLTQVETEIICAEGQ